MKRIVLSVLLLLVLHLPDLSAREKWSVSVHSNLLYLLALTPNLGIEAGMPGGWSIAADFNCSWWSSPKAHFYWRNLGGEFTVRRFLSTVPTGASHEGHHMGFYLQAYSYDYENCGMGSQSPFTWGAGLEYGYTFALHPHFRIDLSLGMGFLGGKVFRYSPVDCHYVVQKTRCRQWFGPSKASLSFSWQIPVGKDLKKGGTR